MPDPRKGWKHWAMRKGEIPPGTLCACGCGQPAEEIHHIQPIAFGGSAFDPANRVPLSKACHRREHKRPTFYLERT